MLLAGFLVRGLPLVAFLTALLALTGAPPGNGATPALLLSTLLAATGLALGIFVEFFALQGDIGRMNTVFKLYLQVWVMWALVSAVSLAWALDLIFGPRRSLRAQAPGVTPLLSRPAVRLRPAPGASCWRISRPRQATVTAMPWNGHRSATGGR